MSWRYRMAWLSARRRANNLSGSVAYWRHRAHEAETKVHIAAVVKADQLAELVAAGRTITELRAAVEIASRQVAHLEAKNLHREGNPS